MGIKSEPFRGVVLSGDDIAKFEKQLKHHRPNAAAVATARRGAQLASEFKRTGQVTVAAMDRAGIVWEFDPGDYPSDQRKATPVATGFLAYFPDAIAAVARVSEAGNRQHGTQGWDKARSPDELNSLSRHLLDHMAGEVYDHDGQRHLAKVAWRALAALQRALDADQ